MRYLVQWEVGKVQGSLRNGSLRIINPVGKGTVVKVC